MRRWRFSKSAIASPWSQSGLLIQLGGLLALALAHGFFISPWASLAVTVCIAWRWLVSRGRLRLPPTWLLLLQAAAGVLVIFLHYRTLLGDEAGVTLVMWLAGCKTLETKTPRDATGLSLLGIFLSFSLLLHQQDLVMTAVVIASSWLFLWSMAADRLTPSLRGLGRKSAGTLMLQALPLTLILFLVFPRIPGPLWRIPAPRPTYQTGVSPTLAPGSVANLARSEAIAFRVRFIGRQPDPDRLYWRGPVMSGFDGYAWQTLPAPRHNRPVRQAARVSYELTLEPHPYAWIYPLEHAVSLPQSLRRLSDGQILAAAPIKQRQRYTLHSSLSETLPLVDTPDVLAAHVQLAGRSNPRSRAWGQELSRTHRDPEVRVAAILERFQNEGYRYTLQPPTLSRDWIDGFLFQTRLGFCEHFAGSMAFVLRASGIPARVVGGYLGGETNPLGDYMIVRQADAHAWVEAWIARKGWVRIDPTSVVAPARLNGLEQALPADEARQLSANTRWLKQLRYVWDSGQNRWNQWVIGYNEESRLKLLKRISKHPSERIVIAMILGGLIVSGFAVYLWLRRRIPAARPSAEQREWQALERWLSKKAYPRNPGEGPLDYTRRVRQAGPAGLDGLESFAQMYIRLRYGHPLPQDSAAALRRLRRALMKTRLGLTRS